MATASAAQGRYHVAFGDEGEVAMSGGGVRDGRERHWHLDLRRIIGSIGRLPTAALADLADVAICLYVADRVARRPPIDMAGGAGGWARHLMVEIPVREPERWRPGPLAEAVADALWLLTEDVWEFAFVQREREHAAASAPPLFAHPLAHSGRAALFSGGLDSLAGVVQDLVSHSDDDVIVFSARSSVRVSAVQNYLMGLLRKRLGSHRELVHVTAEFGIDQHGHIYGDDERSQRTRGFVFLALGAVAALLAGARQLAVYENGIGAINLPYARTQLGVQNARAAHPLVLTAMGRVVTLATGTPFVFRLPYLFQTKAELCRILTEDGLADLIPLTVSCDRFPVRIKDHPQCGVCSSCLLRRQCLHAAGLAPLDRVTAYRHDVLDPAWHHEADEGYALRVMIRQVADLRARLAAPNPWCALTSEYPQLLEVAALADAYDAASVFPQLDIVDLYRRYCAEWDQVPLRGSVLALAA